MINYGNIVGNQEDWADMITNVEAESLPFLSWLPVGEKPVNSLHDYQADEYRDPVVNSHVDGRPVTGFQSAGATRGNLKALIQYATKAAAVTMLHQDVSNIAGVDDELAREIDKSNYELSTDIESAFLGNDEGREDDGANGYKTRGVDEWIESSAQSLHPVPEAFRTPSAQILTTATAAITENDFIDLFREMGTTCKAAKPISGFLAPRAKQVFNRMPYFTPASVLIGGTPTGATGVTFQKGDTNQVGNVAERYLTDYGVVDLRISWRNRQFATAGSVERNYTSFFLHRDRWSLGWNKKPNWRRKEYQGGAYEAFCEAVFMLVCSNPKGEGKWRPAA